jgi:genome maintenance exonuclease 1
LLKTGSKSSRKFDLQLLPKIALKRIDTPEGRRYETPDGVFPSVTTVLGEKLDHSGIDQWRKSIGEAEADKILIQAGNRGTAIHDIAEKYLLGQDDYLAGHMPVNTFTFSSIKPELDNNIGKVYGIEYPLWSKKLFTAGTADLIAEYKGLVSIVDFKTSRKPKKEEYIQSYFLQATCYAMMTEARTDLTVEQIAIIIAVDHEPPQLFIKSSHEYRQRVLDLFTKNNFKKGY